MKKYWFYIISVGFSLYSIPRVYAQSNASKPPEPSANTPELLLNHTVKKGETYYSISKQYKTTVKELQELNPEFPVLKTGSVIKVKRPIPAVADSKSSNSTATANAAASAGTSTGSSTGTATGSVSSSTTASASQAPAAGSAGKTSTQDSIKRVKESARVERTNLLLASDIKKAAVVVTVQSGETLYSISKKYGIPVERIKYLNDLESDNLQIGQVLVLPPEARSTQATEPATNLAPTEPAKALEAPTQKVSDKPTLVPNTAVAPNPVVLSKKDSAVAGKTNTVVPTASTATIGKLEGNKRDAGGMPEQGAKKKVSLKEYEKSVKISVGQTGMDPERHWVLVNNHKTGEVVALVNPDNKTIVWCVVMGPAKGKSDNEIIISEALSKKLNVDAKKSKLTFRYAAP